MVSLIIAYLFCFVGTMVLAGIWAQYRGGTWGELLIMTVVSIIPILNTACFVTGVAWLITDMDFFDQPVFKD